MVVAVAVVDSCSSENDTSCNYLDCRFQEMAAAEVVVEVVGPYSCEGVEAAERPLHCGFGLCSDDYRHRSASVHRREGTLR